MTTAVLAARKLLQQRDPRLALALLAALALTLFVFRDAIAAAPAFGPAMLATAFTALATGAGALPVLFVGNTSARGRSAMLGFGAGVMLAAAAFSLVVPALQTSSAAVVATGVGLGAAVMLLIDRLLPHAHTPDENGHPRAAPGMSRVWLVVLAIALHNVPEGLAVGVAHASGAAEGTAVTLGIGAQNLPEGLIVAWAMHSLGYSRAKSALAALATGLMEPLGALAGVVMVGLSAALLPWGLAFAAGAMIFVVSHEIIPQSHRLGHEGHATTGVTAGFALMLLLTGTLA